MTITPPEKDQPVDELWRKVAELTKVLNALINLEVRVADKKIESGKILLTDDKAVLSLE